MVASATAAYVWEDPGDSIMVQITLDVVERWPDPAKFKGFKAETFGFQPEYVAALSAAGAWDAAFRTGTILALVAAGAWMLIDADRTVPLPTA